MKKTDYGILFLVALIYFGLLATFQKVPGYMDAEYYFGQGLRLVQHHDLVEPFIWNYLNNPTDVIGQGFTFWQPGTSILAAIGMWISGNDQFFNARLLFIVMAACIPLMAAFFATRFMPKRRAGWLAGLIAMFCGLYLPFLTITETFTPFMFFGGLFFISFWFAEKQASTGKKIIPWFILTGVMAGLMSLTRSDGLLWLAGGWVGVVLINRLPIRKWGILIINLGLVLFGFAVVMTPWFVRNLTEFSALFPSGNGLMPWLTKYDDLFVYPSTKLNYSAWITSGIGIILFDRLKALGSNLQTLVAAGGMIFLAPMMVIGFWKQRQFTVIKLALLMLLAILGAMTLIFPYAGERGGLFHSLSAVQVIFWSMVPVGLESIIQWGVQHRKWVTERSWKMFGTALVVVAFIFSALLFQDKLTNGPESDIPWNQTQNNFVLIESKLVETLGENDKVIMVNNPPGYTLATGRPSIMIPTGGADALIGASERYGANYLVLNSERKDIQALVDNEGILNNYFVFMFEVAGNRVYEVNR